MPALVEYDAKMENVAKGDIPMSGESGAIAEIHPRARTIGPADLYSLNYEIAA